MDPVVQSPAAEPCHSSVNANYSDFMSKIDCFAEVLDAKVDAENKAAEAVSLWNTLHEILRKMDAVKLKDFYGLFERLYLLTARLILKGIWYTTITKNNKNLELYKKGLLDPLNGIIALNIHPGKNELCQSLIPLLDSSPWGLPYITVIISQDLNKSSTLKSIVDTLWERENAVLLKVRLEFLCSTKMYEEAFSIAHACYLKGYWNYEDSNGEPTPNENFQHLDYTRELYYQFTDILYLLLCRLNNPTKYNDVLSLCTALEVVERLKSETGKIAPKWKEWKRGSRTIIVAISEYLINGSQFQVDADVLRRLFSHWILCSSKSVEDGEEIHPVKEVLSRINVINTDYAYEFANTILEDFSSHPSSGVKFVEIYIRALNKDLNQLKNWEAAENHNHELMKTHQKKLAQRYLKMADVFSSDKEMSFEMTLTAFSLNPIESLFRRLFETNSSDENVTLNGSIESVTQNQMYNKIELTSTLNDDLQTVIMGCRWTSLCWEKDKSELEKLCRQHMETGGIKIKSKGDLTNLLIDYDTYKPPPLPDDSFNDYGYEKGYEPKAPESSVKKNAKKPRKQPSKVVNSVQTVRQQKNQRREPKTISEKNCTPKPRNFNSSEDSVRLQSLTNSEKVRRRQTSGPGVNKIPKLRIELESRLKKFFVTSSEISGSSLYAPPPDIFISSVERLRAIPPKEFRFLGDSKGIWIAIINSPSYLAEDEQESSLDRIKEKYLNIIPVEEDFLKCLTDQKQSDAYERLKFKCDLNKLQSTVVLQREIPSDLEHRVAFSTAIERVIEVSQESLETLQYAFENPTSSLSLQTIMSSPSDSQLSPASLDDPEILNQIIQEPHNTMTSQNLYSSTTTNVKKSSTRSNALKPGPKGKQNSYLMNQARVTPTRSLEMKAQALGLEIDSNEKVVCAKSQFSPPLNLKSKSSQANSTPLQNLSSFRQPLVIKNGTILTEPTMQINNNEGKMVPQDSTRNADSKILETANLLYGDFIQDDLRGGSTVEEMSNDENNPDETISTATISTRVYSKRKELLLNDDAEPERKLRKISPRQVMSSSNDKTDEIPVRRKRGRPRRIVITCTKEDPIPKEIEVIPSLPEFPPSLPPKIPEISTETIQTHSLYQQDIMYLNEKTGLMELISEDQNLHFEERNEDVCWERRQDNFSSDTEKEVKSSKILQQNEQSGSSQFEEMELMELINAEENVYVVEIVYPNEDQLCEKQQDNFSSDTDVELNGDNNNQHGEFYLNQCPRACVVKDCHIRRCQTNADERMSPENNTKLSRVAADSVTEPEPTKLSDFYSEILISNNNNTMELDKLPTMTLSDTVEWSTMMGDCYYDDYRVSTEEYDCMEVYNRVDECEDDDIMMEIPPSCEGQDTSELEFGDFLPNSSEEGRLKRKRCYSDFDYWNMDLESLQELPLIQDLEVDVDDTPGRLVIIQNKRPRYGIGIFNEETP